MYGAPRRAAASGGRPPDSLAGGPRVHHRPGGIAAVVGDLAPQVAVLENLEPRVPHPRH